MFACVSYETHKPVTVSLFSLFFSSKLLTKFWAETLITDFAQKSVGGLELVRELKIKIRTWKFLIGGSAKYLGDPENWSLWKLD